MVRRTKEDAAETRIRLMDAAEAVFLEKGVSRASLADVAEAAGVTRGAIYWHFKDKSDLFGAMMDRVTLPLEDGCAVFECNAGADPIARLQAATSRVFIGLSQNERMRNVFEIALFKVEYVGDLIAVRERHTASVNEFIERLQRDLRLAQDEQRASMALPAESAAIGLLAMLDGLIRHWILSAGGFDLKLVGARAINAYLVGLGLRLP